MLMRMGSCGAATEDNAGMQAIAISFVSGSFNNQCQPLVSLVSAWKRAAQTLHFCYRYLNLMRT
jgi:hypothetical protein